MDEWKVIIDYPDYEINKYGFVRNLKTLRVLKKSTNAYGYKVLSLYKNKIEHNVRVNRMVAITFIENVDNKPCVNHIDGDKGNDYCKNLEWCTYSENEIHSRRILGKKTISPWAGKFNEENSSSKSVNQIDQDGNVIKIFPSISEAGRAGFSIGCISQVCNGKKELYKKHKWSFNN